ncbi:MAG: cytochrome C [Ignavibacteriae bacterium]|nr:cytochrome C [Ignavibacteriota bacterium]
MNARILVTLPVLTMLALAQATGQQNPNESCVTAKCHATFGKAEFVHGPVAANDCTPCHQLLPKETHKFAPLKKAVELCIQCHEPMKKQAVLHKPVAEGKCTGCHNPHQASQQYMLRGGTTAEMCFGCHNKEMVKKKSAHMPVAEGECLTCHTPHTGDKPKLLVQSGNDLCFECHANMKEDIASAKRVHKPVAEGCVKCHNPHGGDGQSLLGQDVPDQCLTCHKEMREQLAKVIIKHEALDIDKKCMNCHSPHTANLDKQLKEDPMTLCLSCHNQPMASPSGTLANMKGVFEKSKDWHGPIREKDCSGCHDVHGAANFRILRFNYPREFYTSFSQDQYELCFACHQPTLVQDASTTTLTNFRDGDRNLHYLHVNKRVKGRTCRSCHETHASQKEKHIRESVPFGQWSLPIRFEKKLDGGKCSPGCHAPKDYTNASAANKKK